MLHGFIPGVQAARQRTGGGEGGAPGARVGGVRRRAEGGGGLEPLLAGLGVSQLRLSQPAAVATPQPPSQNGGHHTQGDCAAPRICGRGGRVQVKL